MSGVFYLVAMMQDKAGKMWYRVFDNASGHKYSILVDEVSIIDYEFCNAYYDKHDNLRLATKKKNVSCTLPWSNFDTLNQFYWVIRNNNGVFTLVDNTGNMSLVSGDMLIQYVPDIKLLNAYYSNKQLIDATDYKVLQDKGNKK